LSDTKCYNIQSHVSKTQLTREGKNIFLFHFAKGATFFPLAEEKFLPEFPVFHFFTEVYTRTIGPPYRKKNLLSLVEKVSLQIFFVEFRNACKTLFSLEYLIILIFRMSDTS